MLEDAPTRWQVAPHAGGPRAFLHIASLNKITPLGAQFGVDDRRSAPVALADPLFGAIEPNPTEIVCADALGQKLPDPACYAVLDATKVLHLPERLEASGLEHRCLYRGEAFEKWHHVAPWIVRLLPDHGFTRSLFTQANQPGDLWDLRPGIYLRSRASIDTLADHFRRFTKSGDDEGRVFYFRFNDSDVMETYLSGIRDWPERLQNWFLPNNGYPILRIVTILSDGSARIFRPTNDVLVAPDTRLAFRLTERDRRPFRDKVLLQNIREMARDLKMLLPQELQDREQHDLEWSVQQTLDRMERFGVSDGRYLFHFAAWDALWGHGFEQRAPDSRLYDILNSRMSEQQKFSEFEAVLKVLVG
ncbi:DUF4123 domain-containing protein [Paracoccus sulfuroxidans]|uniref:DUF4123 domain-containing protein n=1 Tax=Paracoccus sulfuroxidans TaxID=384678 RepID=UPI00119FDD2F|nr:DUF4123 domain-containing protein [Paracoccus sulfuroxidans]